MVLTACLRLANAWHARVMADEVVSHAFSHGFHPEHSQRLAAYWAGVPRRPDAVFTDSYGDETSVVRIHSGNGSARGDGPSRDRPASTRQWQTSASPTTGWGRCCCDDYFGVGDGARRCPDTTGPQRMSRTGCTSRGGRGTDSSTGDGASNR